jgi:Protein of unknown function (DUF1622)
MLGLEFELAADVIRTAISPTWTDIAQLGSIALIRTFLNYFLEKDLERFGETITADVTARQKPEPRRTQSPLWPTHRIPYLILGDVVRFRLGRGRVPRPEQKPRHHRTGLLDRAPGLATKACFINGI